MPTTAATITDAAMGVLDEVGLDRLSMRAVADRLGVQVGGLYYHLPDKQALLRSMADRICRRALEQDPPAVASPAESESPAESAWAAESAAYCAALRGAMLACRDGARLVLEGPLIGSEGALEVMERLTSALTRSGIPATRVRVGADTLMSYVTGFVLQEQLELRVGDAPRWPVAELTERFPLVFAAGGGPTGMTADALFAAGIALVLAGLRAAV